jgi:hypothetical protein
MKADRNTMMGTQAAQLARCDSLLVAKRVWGTSGSLYSPDELRLRHAHRVVV